MTTQLLDVESMAFGGDAVGRLEGRVVFVPFGVPGDRLRLRLTQQRKQYSRGEIVEVVSPGAGRRSAPCPYFGACGGCQWQQLAYAHQVSQKSDIFERAVRGAGSPEVLPILPSALELGYRRRVRMHWRVDEHALALGYYRWRSRELLDVGHCPLLCAPLQHGVDQARQLLSSSARGAGSLVALAGRSGEVHLSIRGERGSRIDLPAETSLPPPLTGGEVQRGADRLTLGAPTIALGGPDEPPLLGTAAAFAQASADQERALRRIVGEWAGPAARRVVELHAGIGNLTRALAAVAQEVVAVESSPAAVGLLRQNSAALPAPVRVVASPVERALPALRDQGERFELMVLDPPREGSPGLASLAAALGVRRIVYVSCDPMTLVRDVRELGAEGFVLRRAQALDMMPQSFHIESVSLLER